MKKIIITALAATAVTAMAQLNPIYRTHDDPHYIYEIVVNQSVSGRRFVVEKAISLYEPMFIFKAFEIDCKNKTHRWLYKGTPRTMAELKASYTDEHTMVPWRYSGANIRGEIACEVEQKK